jgi:hypothetical protein
MKVTQDDMPKAMTHEVRCTPSASPSVQQQTSPTQNSGKSCRHGLQNPGGGNTTPLSTPVTVRSVTPMSPQGHTRGASLGSYYKNSPFLVPQCPLSAPPSLAFHHHAKILPAFPTVNLGHPHPPRISVIQKAMEGAIVKERRREKELETQEESMTAEELRVRLRAERHRMAKLAAELAKHKMITVHSELEAEMVEEGRVNGLIRRLEEIQIEKGQMFHEPEGDEAMVGPPLEQVRQRNNKDNGVCRLIVLLTFFFSTCEQLINSLVQELDHARHENVQLERLMKGKQDLILHEAKIMNRPTAFQEDENMAA